MKGISSDWQGRVGIFLTLVAQSAVVRLFHEKKGWQPRLYSDCELKREQAAKLWNLLTKTPLEIEPLVEFDHGSGVQGKRRPGVAWLIGDMEKTRPKFIRKLAKHRCRYAVLNREGEVVWPPIVWRLPMKIVSCRLLAALMRKYRIESVDHNGASEARQRYAVSGLGHVVSQAASGYSGKAVLSRAASRIVVFRDGHFLPPFPGVKDKSGRERVGLHLTSANTLELVLPAWARKKSGLKLYEVNEVTKFFMTHLASARAALIEDRKKDDPVEAFRALKYGPRIKRDDSAPKTILMLTSSLKAGGAERQWSLLSGVLAKHGYRVVLLVYDRKGNKGHYEELVRRTPGVELLDFDDLEASEVSLDKDLADWYGYTTLGLVGKREHGRIFEFMRLKLALQLFKPDLILSQLDSTNVVAGLASRFTPGVKVSMSFRNQPPHLVKSGEFDMFQRFYRFLAEDPAVLLNGNSRQGNDAYAEWLGVESERVKFLRNIMDPQIFELDGKALRLSKRKELGWAPETRVVMGIFRLVPQKRPELFLRAAALIREKDPNCHFVLVGDGDERDCYEKLAAELGLAECVTFLGYRKDVLELICAADVVLHTSINEGTPNAIMEAQALGVPAVCAAVGGVPSLISDGETGFLCHGSEPGTFADAVCRVLSNPDLGAAVSVRAREARLRDSTGEDWVEYVEQVIK